MFSIVNIEKQNLNCLWDKPELIYKFDRPYFVSEVGRDIFFTIKELFEADIKITSDEIAIYGNSRNPTITKENLLALRESAYSVDNFEFYFTSLKKKYAQHEIEEKILKDTLVQASSKGELNLEKLEELSYALQENIDIIRGKESVLQSIQQIGGRYRQTLKDRIAGKYKFSTGDSVLDNYVVKGFAPGQITTLYGATSVGKSVFALNLFNKQINKKIPSLYVNLEMDETSTMDRLIALRRRIPSRSLEFKDPETDEAELVFKLLDEEIQLLMKNNNRFFIVDDPSLSISDLELLIKESKKRFRSDYLVCTIDLLTMLSDIGSTPQDLEASMNRLHELAKRQHVHLMGVVQANRSADSATVASIDQLDRLRPRSLHSIKNSASFAERSRLVLSVFREKHYASELFPDDPGLEFMDDIMKITILKQSAGQVGQIVKYLYEPEFFRLFPYIENDEEEIIEEN